MSVPAHSLQLSIDEYLDLEEASDVRHEFVSGRMFAMAGATQAQDAIVINLTVLIGSKVQGSGCRLFSSDMKIRRKVELYKRIAQDWIVYVYDDDTFVLCPAPKLEIPISLDEVYAGVFDQT